MAGGPRCWSGRTGLGGAGRVDSWLQRSGCGAWCLVGVAGRVVGGQGQVAGAGMVFGLLAMPRATTASRAGDAGGWRWAEVRSHGWSRPVCRRCRRDAAGPRSKHSCSTQASVDVGAVGYLVVGIGAMYFSGAHRGA